MLPTQSPPSPELRHEKALKTGRCSLQEERKNLMLEKRKEFCQKWRYTAQTQTPKTPRDDPQRLYRLDRCR